LRREVDPDFLPYQIRGLYGRAGLKFIEGLFA
jgi:hypothetical protein